MQRIDLLNNLDEIIKTTRSKELLDFFVITKQSQNVILSLSDY